MRDRVEFAGFLAAIAVQFFLLALVILLGAVYDQREVFGFAVATLALSAGLGLVAYYIHRR